jgi:glycosyltransferase involved in cell wall biosynthesis
MTDPGALVLVTSSFPIGGDGSEAAGSFVADLATELARLLPVRVVAPGREESRSIEPGGIEVFRYASPPKALSNLRPWLAGDLSWFPKVITGGARATAQAVAAGPTAHILALWGLPCGAWARHAGRRTGTDYSVWMLGSDVWMLGRLPYLRGLLGRVMRDARHRYADGFELAQASRRIGGMPVDFLPSTRRMDFADPPPVRSNPPYRLLFLGRWHPNKGPDLLLDALDSLDEVDWRRIERIEIQGGGPMEALVRQRCAALVARGRPVVAGAYLTKDEAEAAIARCDWMIIPSRVESIPVVFSDAMKMGRPVICTPVGDLHRLVAEGRAGICAGSVDAAGIARALHEALNGSTDAFRNGVAAAAARFDLGEVAATIFRTIGRKSALEQTP